MHFDNLDPDDTSQDSDDDRARFVLSLIEEELQRHDHPSVS